jgi:hypothetical protein
VHIDGFLSNVALNYMPKGHIADMIAPIVDVQKQSDNYAVWSKADWFRTETADRAPGTEAGVITLNVTSDSYMCKNYALKEKLKAEEMANTDLPWGSTTQSAAEFVTSKLWTAWEGRAAAKAKTSTNVNTTFNVGSAWGTANATPYDEIEAALSFQETNTGFRPNRLLLGGTAWDKLKTSTQMRDLLFPHGGGVPTTELVRNLFDLDSVLVGRAIVNSAHENQTASLGNIWGPNAWLYYAPLAPSVREPSWMYTFRWVASPLGVPMGAEVHPFDNKTKSQEVEVGHYLDEKIVSSELCYEFVAVDSST